MKRASSRPQQLKEQLLQAIDAQHNQIQNMMAVLDVICCLERYPMTKEALVETRLGKLINDVRKRSTDKDLVKRLKKLVRSWQRLVGVNEAAAKGLSSPVDSVPAEHIPGSAQTFTENYSRTLFHNNMSQRDEMSGKNIKYPISFRKSKIPVRAIRPYSSSIKNLQQFTSLRPSLSNQHSQEQHKPQRQDTSVSRSDTKHLMVGDEPAQSTRVTSNLALNSSIQDSNIKMQQSSDHLNILKPATLNVNLYEVSSTVTDIRTFEDTKNQHNNHTVKLDGRPAEDNTKTTQQQAGKLTYDPHNLQIRPISSKTSDCQRSTGSEIQGSERLKQKLCSVQQTSWREMSQYKMIQNSLPTLERSGMDSVAENFKQETNLKVYKKTHAFIPDFPVTDLPGVSREITERDLVRVRSHRWHGVNGCYDNRNNWYDWTQSITLDAYGDGSKLKILPYVAIDYRF
ncbi:mediator of RNA polymerase II transcription subunit 26-like isoform X1 [Chanodichthys erythropterus]|uniref:mediator of RNA polymerase II transcription subunit 26-like isoform X1 n=1 Tax=Chanodichthys erythropterus TaxID=933992 RepID=UPI00351F53C4